MNGPSLTSSTCHLGPEPSGFHRRSRVAESGDEPVDQRHRLLRRRSAGEPGSTATADVGVERELAHDEERAADVGDREVRPPVRVGEVAQAEELVGHAVDGGIVVIGPDAGQDDRAESDLTEPLVAFANRCAGHALDDEAHRPRETRTGWRMARPMPRVTLPAPRR